MTDINELAQQKDSKMSKNLKEAVSLEETSYQMTNNRQIVRRTYCWSGSNWVRMVLNNVWTFYYKIGSTEANRLDCKTLLESRGYSYNDEA